MLPDILPVRMKNGGIMKKSEKAALAVELLKKEYPEAVCSLTETEPFRLLVAVRLSAQCTDKRVNEVTPALFERFPTVEDMANADVREVEELIRSCGTGLYLRAGSIQPVQQVLDEKQISTRGIYQIQRDGGREKRYVRMK